MRLIEDAQAPPRTGRLGVRSIINRPYARTGMTLAAELGELRSRLETGRRTVAGSRQSRAWTVATAQLLEPRPRHSSGKKRLSLGAVPSTSRTMVTDCNCAGTSADPL